MEARAKKVFSNKGTSCRQEKGCQNPGDPKPRHSRMGKTLVIAEKPSVQTDLALSKELGKFSKKGKDRNSYFENDAAIITSAVGHLVELKMPEGPNGKKLPWGSSICR